MIDLNHKTILISRTDSIGDVVLTLPMCGVLKKNYPNCKIIFLGRNYTLPILNRCQHIDEAISFDTLEKHTHSELVSFFKQKNISTFIHVFPNKILAKVAKEAKIPIRIGTLRRIFHLLTCNKTVNLKRKSSDKHEAQLNIELLKPLDIKADFSLNEIVDFYGFDLNRKTTADFSFLDADKIKIILHPKSKGSAKEWGFDNFSELIKMLDKNKYQLFFSGTKQEGELFKKELIEKHPEVIDLTGKFTLDEFIDFISCCDGIVGASTGPLHIAAALNKKTIGLYTNIRPMFPTRWAPLGINAVSLTETSESITNFLSISAKTVFDELEKK
ncbi:MAG: glycosyltransferase family 9 protein [Bacteroidota bacterium]